ncbi:MAG: hypothetical protein E4H28_06005 [Gemmatimonadales bacterium]|nr:MAG: hypothetical protein E4H28_06005 [Gemmatimonadales bacterium]
MPKAIDQVIKDQIETEDAFEAVTVTAEEEGIIRGVKLLGLRSRNRRNYDTPGVQKSGVSMLEGALVYIDHPPTPTTPRSYRDKIGRVESVKYRAGHGHFGDIRYNPKHASADQFLWDVKNSPNSLGMSINAKYRPGKTDKNGDTVVEALEMVRSVDIVTKPATADGIFEHETPSDEEDEDMSLDLKTLKEKHSDIVEQLLAEHKQSSDESSELEQARKEAKEALEQLAAIKAEADAKKLHDAIESQFAEIFKGTTVTEDIVKDIVECACQMAEEPRAKMVEAVGKLGPMLVEIPEDDGDEPDPADADEQEVEEEEKPESVKPAYKPASGKSGKINFKRDILGIS